MIDIALPELTTNPLFLGVVFILFVLSIKKLKKIVFNALWIGAAAVLFPIAMNRLFGLPLATDANSIIFYLTFGLGAYFIYLFARSVYTVLGAAEKIFSPITRRVKNVSVKKRDKKIDKLLKNKEKEEKQKKEESMEKKDARLEKLSREHEKRKKSKEYSNDYVVLKDAEEKDELPPSIMRKFREADD